MTTLPAVGARGLGITAGLDPGPAGHLATRGAALGYHSLWSNDEASAPGLETLAHFAAAAPELDLGVGVLPLGRYSATRIAADVHRLGLDSARLWLGVGSGALSRPVESVAGAVGELRELLPGGTRIVVAAMRPRLCHLGGAVADGVLLNWMLPAQASRARQWVQAGAEEAGRPAPLTALYVRVAVGEGASERLRVEEGRYRRINEGHRRHFEAMDVPLGSVGVAGPDRAAVVAGLAPFHDAVDLPIVRVLAARDAPSLLAVADAAAP